MIARFVHITDARLATKIRRNGLRAARGRSGARQIFCIPVVPDVSTVYQWVRELKRRGYRSSVAIVFVIPDDEIVSVCRFAQPEEKMTAAEAAAFFAFHTNPLGYQALVSRTIEPREIRVVRPAPETAGWRYYPEAKGKRPLWPFRGEIKSRRIRKAIDAR